MLDTHVNARSPIATGLSQFVTQITFESIPDSVVHIAKMHLLDSFGVALAAASLGEATGTATALEKMGGGQSRVPGLAHHLSARDAAMVTAMLIHGLEFDDTSVFGRIHPSAVCGSVALALASQQKLHGKDLLTAYVAGIETSIRIGAAAKGGFTKVGFDATSIVGTFGAALVAGRLMGLTPDNITSALSIAYSFTSGNREFMAELAWTKRVHPGSAAAGGITAAAIAMNGFLAPFMPFEGKFGLYNLYLPRAVAPEPDLSRTTDGLGKTWLLAEDLAYKPVPLCFFNIPAADAAIALAQQHDIKVADIAEVTVLLPEAAIATVCEPNPIRRQPTHRFAAQFSVYYAVASALLRRRMVLDDLNEQSLADPAVLELCSKVGYRIDTQTTFPKYYCAAVIVKMKDGRTFEKRENIHRGCPDRKLTDAEVLAKFTDNARRVHSADRVERVRDAIMRLDRIECSSELENLLALDGA